MSLEPFKIVGQLVAMRRDADGLPVGEEVVADFTLYSGEFGELQSRVDEAWPEIVRADEAKQQGGGAGPAQ